MNKLLITCSFLLTLIFSCKRNEEIFSCNEKINAKVKKYREVNQTITRYDLAHLEDLDYQIGVFLSLSPENKVRIFKEKINSEQNNAHLTSAEKSILKEMIDFLKPEHYTNSREEFQTFANSKESILRNLHGWDDAKVYIFTNSWMLESEILDYIATKAMSGPSGTGGSGGGGGGLGNNCTCYYGYYCWLKGSGSGDCKEGGCKIPNGGCGIFGNTSCDGLCK